MTPLRLFALWVGLMFAASPGTGAPAAPVADDPALEAHLNRLAGELRCLVCQNQSLADSHADLAIDLKNQVREQLKAGRSDAEVMSYLTDRYGDFVLYRPPLKASTGLLWGGPLLLLSLGALVCWRTIGAHRPSGDTPSLETSSALAAALLIVDAPAPTDDDARADEA